MPAEKEGAQTTPVRSSNSKETPPKIKKACYKIRGSSPTWLTMMGRLGVIAVVAYSKPSPEAPRKDDGG